MMNLNDAHGFSSDRPIKRIEDDLLERACFAKNLADALAGWHGKDSLVVALHGDWGSGKSSIKNMAISELEKRTDNKPEIIEFSPWEWAAQEKISASFFQEISATIGRKDKSKQGKKLSGLLKKYGRYLNTGELLVSGFSRALPTLFTIASISGAGNYFIDNSWIKNISGGLLAVTVGLAVVLNWGASFLNKCSGNVDETIKEYDLSLSQLRSELTKLLSERDNSLLVIMDDLDRLTTEQLRMVFQLVKANAEFPNVVFLLLFQRDLVEEKLNDGKQMGRDYLEKIIQVPFDIPKIEASSIHDLLFENINKIIGQDESAVNMFNTVYWGNVFYGALFSYFGSLRNVYRFSSTLSFHFSLLRGQKTFEVNPVDLIAIECLRLFEPDVYQEIARSKSVFTKNGSAQHERERQKLIIESVIAKATQDKNECVTNLIKHLFPTVEWALGGSNFDSGFGSRWLREMRICHPSNFDKYFQFSIRSDEIAHSDLLEMLKHTSSTDKFKAFIFALEERRILANALGQFEAYIDQIPLENAEPFIQALLDVGDMVEHQPIGFKFFNSHIHMVRLAIWFLRRIENLEDRSQILLKCFKSSNGLSIVEHILMGEENRREKEAHDALVLADYEFEDLKQEFVRKLDEMANASPEVLMNHRHLISFLYRWKKWGDEGKVCSWLKEQVANRDFCLKLLKAFMIKSSAQGMGDYVAHIFNSIRLENIEDFIPIELLQEKLAGINVEELDSNSQEALSVFYDAIKERKQ